MQVQSVDTLITAISETLCLLRRDEHRMQLISCHISGRRENFAEGIMLNRKHVELYTVMQCILRVFEKQTNTYRKLLKPGQHIEIFTVKELHNTHCSTFQQVWISAILVWLVKISSLYKLYWDFVV